MAQGGTPAARYVPRAGGRAPAPFHRRDFPFHRGWPPGLAGGPGTFVSVNNKSAATATPRMKTILYTYSQPVRLTNRWSLLWLIASLLLVSSCKKETDTTPRPVGTVVANAGPDQPVQVGQTVTLDGSASTDTDNKPLTYLWTIVRKPAKSTITLSDVAAVKPTFKADEVGEYEIELTVSSANGKATDRVVVAASVAEPIAITSNITVKTNLIDRIANPDLPDYIVTKSIDVTSELTINPGVVIAFERDVRVNVNDGGGLLIAKGTAQQRIKLMGVQKTKGYWVGIALYSGSNANVLEYVDVLHAGSRPLYSTTKAALFMSGGSKAQIALKNTQFAQNDGYGVYVYEGGILREFQENAFTNHTEAGILLDAANVAKLDPASTFKGNNGRDVVEVTPSAITGAQEVVWPGFTDKTPYRLTGDLSVNAGFKLNPGVTLEMNRDVTILVNTSGYLSAKGTETDKVIFTGANRTAGYWRGIICYSANNKNALDHAEVSHAGSVAIVSGKKANVAIYGTRAAMSITKTRISNSGGYGVFVSYGASANTDLSTANTFTSNTADNVLIEK
ncbi:PKD domain-containing protein [Fibrella aestuarina BUZ 2]|uniref:PKD domain-containing protein n=1 Tax=Fibrella aestuarina BUZ 2 TaxID=1166018 RepID=I0KAP6_9BACT|nr:PKD domain-containing protein [Fibrella aestuarina]CCH01199.1 PKD domain-containing protein [Fibrella aestuarina BUZ 2]